jgi:hypothetical protein
MLGHEDSGDTGERRQRLRARRCAEDRLEHGLHQLFRLTHHDRVHERREGQRIGKRQRAAGDHERVVRTT